MRTPLRVLVGCLFDVPAAPPVPDPVDPGRARVTLENRLLRPAEVDHLVGDASKAAQKLGWKPQVTFEQLVGDMVDADLRREQSSGWPAAPPQS